MNVIPLEKRKRLAVLAAKGATIREIARELKIHRETVRGYVRKARLGLSQSDGLKRHHARRKAEGRPILPPWQRNGRPREAGSLSSKAEAFVREHPDSTLYQVADALGMTSVEARHLVSRRLKALVLDGRLARWGSIKRFQYRVVEEVAKAAEASAAIWRTHLEEAAKSSCECRDCVWIRAYNAGYDDAMERRGFRSREPLP
jgi:DNA-binding CsgD family transcriptional regulator